MHSDSSTSQPQQTAGTARTEATRTMLQLLLEAQKLQATKIRIEAPAKEATTMTVEFFGEGTTEATKTMTLPAEAFGSVWNCFEQRLASWPEPNDELFIPSSNCTRLLCAPLSSFRMLSECLLQRGSQSRPSAIYVEKIRRDLSKSMLEMINLSATNREALVKVAKQRTGLLLANAQSKAGAPVDGGRLLAALRPDAVYLPDCRSAAAAKEALRLAETNLVIAGISGNDPVESVFHFISYLDGSAEQRAEFSERFLLSFVHLRVRRSCGSCSKSSAVTPSTIERLPEVLRAGAKDTYFFGRGCKECGFSAYRGTVGLDSLMYKSEVVKEQLSTMVNAEALTMTAYAEGTRSLLEDGLHKIYAGLTSFEEVFAVTAQMSPAFAAAAKSVSSPRSKTSGSMALTSERNAEAYGKPKLLIVEDDINQQQVLRVVFESEGYEVFGAMNGKDALAKLKSQPVDIIVCDLMMPEIDGMTFVKHLRATPEIAELPVLMLTAGGDTDEECKLLECGADDYCRKNMRRKVLISRVSRLLERKGAEKNPLDHMLAE